MEDCIIEWMVERVREERSKKVKMPGPAVHDDLCVIIDERGHERHQFAASRPSQPWLTHISERKTSDDKLYLCAVKDEFGGRIVNYSIDSRMKASLAVRAVRNAVRARQNVNEYFVHSEGGSQFRLRKLCRVLAAQNLVGSIGRVASRGDDAALESFFRLWGRTTSTGAPETLARSCVPQSQPGTNGPTTGDGDKLARTI